MRKLRRLAAFGGLLVVVTIGVGCENKPETKAPSGPAATPAAGPTYKASLEEGIDFRKDGLPEFLAEVQGLSGREPWGRWSDAGLAPVVRLTFRQPLPRRFELSIVGLAFDQNDKLPVLIRVGDVKKSVSFDKPAWPQTQVLVFDLTQDANVLEITPPKPLSPKALNADNKDDRQLGIGLVTLKIRKG